MADKRSRSQNWSKSEISQLKALVLEHEYVLNQKHSNEVTNKKKKLIWDTICQEINLMGVCKRTVDEVKTKWSNETRRLKRSFSDYQREQKKTGGGPPPKSPSSEDERVIELFKNTASFSGIRAGVDCEPTEAEGIHCYEIYKKHYVRKSGYGSNDLFLFYIKKSSTCTFQSFA